LKPWFARADHGLSKPVGASVTPNTDFETSRTDVELIAAMNRGDTDAFEVLYWRYRDWVVGLAFRLTGDDNAALDVMQETFLYFLKKFPGFRLTAQMKTFLYPAVRNLSIAARRKAGRYQATPIEMEQIEQTAAPEPMPTGTGDLATVLAQLPEEQREVLMLRFVDGLSLAEIAAAMDIPLGTVKSRLHNSLQTLRADERTKTFFEI
jgi:RNA polymerase sigma-70 factor (ECF subfamily)